MGKRIKKGTIPRESERKFLVLTVWADGSNRLWFLGPEVENLRKERKSMTRSEQNYLCFHFEIIKNFEKKYLFQKICHCKCHKRDREKERETPFEF